MLIAGTDTLQSRGTPGCEFWDIIFESDENYRVLVSLSTSFFKLRTNCPCDSVLYTCTSLADNGAHIVFPAARTVVLDPHPSPSPVSA